MDLPCSRPSFVLFLPLLPVCPIAMGLWLAVLWSSPSSSIYQPELYNSGRRTSARSTSCSLLRSLRPALVCRRHKEKLPDSQRVESPVVPTAVEAMKPTKGKRIRGGLQTDRQTARPCLCKPGVGSTPHYFPRACALELCTNIEEAGRKHGQAALHRSGN